MAQLDAAWPPSQQHAPNLALEQECVPRTTTRRRVNWRTRLDSVVMAVSRPPMAFVGRVFATPQRISRVCGVTCDAVALAFCRNADVDERTLQLLLAAEDHRFFDHAGIDPIALVRAAFANIRRPRSQGASTLEQQFARHLLQDYRPTIARKKREMLLAVFIAARYSKREVLAAYVGNIRFGSDLVGLDSVLVRWGMERSTAPISDLACALARLKHPEAHSPTDRYWSLIEGRATHIIARQKELYLS